MTQQILAGKNGLVFGVTNKRNIAWAIATASAAHGARLILIKASGWEGREGLIGKFGEKAALISLAGSNEINTIYETGADRIDMRRRNAAHFRILGKDGGELL